MGLLRRLMGNPVSDKVGDEWPQLAKSWAGRQVEMPTESAGVNSIRPMGFLAKKFFGPTVQGATTPWGTIMLNRDNIERDKIDLDDLLVHELTHVGQKQKSGLFSYLKSGGSKDLPPEEEEAFAAERNRKVRRTDIELKAPK